MSPRTPSETDPVDRNTAIALFRYGLIAQLVHTPPESGQQEQLLREIAARTYTIPGSTRTRDQRHDAAALPQDLSRRKASTPCARRRAPIRTRRGLFPPPFSRKPSPYARNNLPAPRRRSSTS